MTDKALLEAAKAARALLLSAEHATMAKTMMECSDKAIHILDAAIAAAEAERCMCKDRAKADCPGEWEPGCDLGNNEKFVNPQESERHMQSKLISLPGLPEPFVGTRFIDGTNIAYETFEFYYAHQMREYARAAIAAAQAEPTIDGWPLYSGLPPPPPECETEAEQAEKCWCDEQGVGETGVSCGDCPMRDYKAEQSASATSVQEPVLGERWYILRKGATTCSTVIIELVTPAVIGVKTDAWGAIEVIPRYYLTLVERVASAPTPAQGEKP